MATEGKWISRSTRAKNENEASWNKRKDTGWKYEGGRWVQYRGGKPTGRTAKTRLGTSQLSALNPTQWGKKNTSKLKKNTTNNNLTEKDKEDIRKENELQQVLTSSGKYKKVDAPGTKNKGKKVIQRVNGSGSKKSKPNTSTKSTVHTRHYKTGERLGVMGANQRRKYEKEAAGRTFEGEVAKYQKESGHGKPHLRETLYKRSQRWPKKSKSKKNTKSTKTDSNKKKLTIKQQKESKLLEQQTQTARIMANDPRYKGPAYKKLKASASRFN